MTTSTRMTFRILVTGLAIGAGFAAAAATDDEAKGKMHRERPAFSTLDTDGNGQLTRDEMLAHGKARFEARDTNGDGQLSLEELNANAKARSQRHLQRMIDRMDANDDGMVSFDEMTSGKRGERMSQMFERADADENGTISAKEFAEMGKHGRGHKRGLGWGKKQPSE